MKRCSALANVDEIDGLCKAVGIKCGEGMTEIADPKVQARIDALLKGAIDPHVHSGPSIAPRGIDHVTLLQQASQAGFAAVVTKDHDYSGVMTAELIRQHFPELKTKIYSSIVLNNVVGGLNPYAVEHTAALGGRIVWLPHAGCRKPSAMAGVCSMGAPGLHRADATGYRHSGAERRRRYATT